MNHRTYALVALGSIIGILTVFPTTAQAQLFSSPRGLGRTLSPRQGTMFEDNQGEIQGDERYLRDNRNRSDFVGSSRASQQGFVGSEQALGVGRVLSAIETLAEFQDRSPAINRPLTQPPGNVVYAPRLVLDFTVAPQESVRQSQELQTRLAHLWEVAGELPIEVLVADRRAILRGEVPSAAIAEKVEILLSFEPGIDEIQNELAIVPPSDGVPLPARTTDR